MSARYHRCNLPRLTTHRISNSVDVRYAVLVLASMHGPERSQPARIVTDQAELHGHLQKVRDIGLPLVSVTSGDPDQPDVSTLAPHQVPTIPPRRTT